MIDFPETATDRLTAAQRNAIYPGPGNPEYVRGSAATMRAMERLVLVKTGGAVGRPG